MSNYGARLVRVEQLLLQLICNVKYDGKMHMLEQMGTPQEVALMVNSLKGAVELEEKRIGEFGKKLYDANHELDRHCELHQCGTADSQSPHYIGGFMNCPIAKAIWDNIPLDERQPLLA